MFDFLSSKLEGVFSALGKTGSITENDLEKALREIRISLLEADVALPVVQKLFNEVKEEALGEKIFRSLAPKQMIVKIMHDKLQSVVSQSSEETEIKLRGDVATLMLVGLQGVGKTTTCSKIAHFLQKNYSSKVLMVSLDLQRAAAYNQLKSLALKAKVGFFEFTPTDFGGEVNQIALAAKAYAKEHGFKVLIVDTAGRTSIDEPLMQQLRGLSEVLNPSEVILVADSMLGQVSVKMAQDFQSFVPLTGLVLTKMEGNSRGGALLSIKYVTGIPVKFTGVGEHMDDLEIFSSQRIADRILQMGDVVTLVEKVSQLESDKEIKGLNKRLSQGIYTMDDFKKQCEGLMKLGGIGGFMGMIPGLGKMKDKIKEAGIDDTMLKRQIAIINSMTKAERKTPSMITSNRKKRIAAGCGQGVDKVNKLLKQYEQSAKMLKKFRQGKLKNLTDLAKMNNNL